MPDWRPTASSGLRRLAQRNSAGSGLATAASMWRPRHRETAQNQGPELRIWRGNLTGPDCPGPDWAQTAKAVPKARNGRELGHPPAASRSPATKRNRRPRSVTQPLQETQRHVRARRGRNGTHPLEVRKRPPSVLRLRPECDLVLRKFPTLGDQRSRVLLQDSLITYSRPFPAQITVTRSVVR